MLKQYRHLNHKYQKGSMGTFFLREVNQTLTGYEEQVAGMLKSSSAAQDAVSGSILNDEYSYSNN